MLKIILIDDHQVTISGLENALDGLPDINIVATFSAIDQAIYYLRKEEIDVVITDLYFEDEEPLGITLAKKIKQQYPSVKVLMYSSESRNGQILRIAYQAGIDGYVPKNAPLQELILALTELGKGKKYFNQEILLKIVDFAKEMPEPITITPAEKRILEWLNAGKTRKEITQEILNTSTGAYDTHLYHLKQKFEVKSIVDMLKKAKLLGILNS